MVSYLVSFLKSLLIDSVKIIFFSVTAYGGWLLFHYGGKWYLSVLGCILMASILNVILPLLDLLLLLFDLIWLPCVLLLTLIIKLIPDKSQNH